MLGKNLIQAAAGNAAGEVLGVEDVFSTWLYTGNSSTQTITNGIDLAGEGGLVWIKGRNFSDLHMLADTARGAGNRLSTSTTTAPYGFDLNYLSSFTSTGFTLGSDSVVNGSANTYASWTFRKAPGFFDVVTYTGNGSNRTIAHSLGSVPGCIIVKRTDSSANWQVYHRSLISAVYYLELNNANAQSGGGPWNGTAPTSTVFSLGTDSNVNASGGTYVAYLFAHDEQIFGESGDQSVIKCGNCAAGTEENLDWEPQWVLVKKATAAGDWRIYDNMRMQNLADYVNKNRLMANAITAESADGQMQFTATGFKYEADSIYIAIRRGPMKTPTSGTEVMHLYYANPAADGTSVTTGFPVDMCFQRTTSSSGGWGVVDRMRGLAQTSSNTQPLLVFNAADAEFATGSDMINTAWNTGYTIGGNRIDGFAGISHTFRRAPGFFDVVAYTGTGSVRTVSHNLGVIPELMIFKVRSNTNNWSTYVASIGNNNELNVNLNLGSSASGAWNNTTPTSSVFTLGGLSSVNANAATYVAYLFATLPGISKVGSYTGTGTTLSVDCGFTAGARFVLIKRTDSTGDWYVWDSARGIVAANDPFLLLNSTAAENTSTDYIDPLSSGFQISSTAPAAINASGGSFIFLAIA